MYWRCWITKFTFDAGFKYSDPRIITVDDPNLCSEWNQHNDSSDILRIYILPPPLKTAYVENGRDVCASCSSPHCTSLSNSSSAFANKFHQVQLPDQKVIEIGNELESWRKNAHVWWMCWSCVHSCLRAKKTAQNEDLELGNCSAILSWMEENLARLGFESGKGKVVIQWEMYGV